MKTILETLREKEFQLTKTDILIYEEYLEIYSHPTELPKYATLFANISFLLSSRRVVEHLLTSLENNVKGLWEQENKLRTIPLTLNTPNTFVEHIGLSWPLPKAELTQNKTQHLLSRVLLAMENKHNINIQNEDTYSPIPTIVGVVTNDEIKKVIAKQQLWNEEPKLASLCFHGKMSHRIQFYLLMEACNQKILDLENLTIINLIDLLSNEKNGNNSTFWGVIVDALAVARNIPHLNILFKDSPNPEPLTTRLKPSINTDNQYSKDYVYAMDPYFLHSYLMTVAREKFPYLSECVTEIFCKSAFAAMNIENRIGYQIKLDRCWPPSLQPKLVEIPMDERTIEHSLARQAKCFRNFGVHVITPQDIVNDQDIRNKSIGIIGGKPQKIFSPMLSETKKFTFFPTAGIVQYRQQLQQTAPESQKLDLKKLTTSCAKLSL